MTEVHDLSALLRAVTTARGDVDDARRRRSAPGAPTAEGEQRELLSALERYVTELARRGQPVPYRLRNEVTMYRLLFHVARRTWV